MFVGEIGGNRDEFLYRLKWWEVRAVIRGYLHRYRHLWEIGRVCAYASAHCMGSKIPPPPPRQWMPFAWEKHRAAGGTQPTEKEIEELRQMIISENEGKV